MAPHILALSATPIPRTLALALYGDMSLTRITDLPPGTPVKTIVLEGNETGFENVFQVEFGKKVDRSLFFFTIVDLHDGSGPTFSQVLFLAGKWWLHRMRSHGATKLEGRAVLAPCQLGPSYWCEYGLNM